MSISWFNQWAQDYHQAGGVEIPWADDQLARTGLSLLCDNFLSNVSDVNEIIALLEKGVMHFFKVVVESQKPQRTIDPQAISAHASAPTETAGGIGYDYEKITAELWRRLLSAFEKPAWHPKEAWLTAAIIDLGLEPLPQEAQESLKRCPTASQELAKHYRKYIRPSADTADPMRLPRDNRTRVRVALAALADLLALGTPIQLHDRNYQKHRRAVRLVRSIAHAHRLDLAEHGVWGQRESQ